MFINFGGGSSNFVIDKITGLVLDVVVPIFLAATLSRHESYANSRDCVIRLILSF